MQLIHFKPNFNVEILDSEQVILFSEDQQHLLLGSVYVAIAEIIKFTPLSEKNVIDILLTKFPSDVTPTRKPRNDLPFS